MSDWLSTEGVTHIAMEAKGVYWKPVWHIVSDGDFELVLANAAHVENGPRRKTDVDDSTWLANLMAHGLIRPGFVPDKPTQQIRDLLRTVSIWCANAPDKRSAYGRRWRMPTSSSIRPSAASSASSAAAWSMLCLTAKPAGGFISANRPAPQGHVAGNALQSDCRDTCRQRWNPMDLQPSRHIGQRNPEGPGQPEWRYTNSRSGTSFSVRAGRRLRFCSVLRGPGGRCDKREKGRRCTTGI